MTSQHDKPLAGRVAYITGAGRGQGRAHAIRLAADGADIVAIDTCDKPSPYNHYPATTSHEFDETISAVRDLDSDIIAERVDVRDLAGQQKVIQEAITRFGRLDIVVANAGIASWARLWEIEADQWRDVIDINLTGVWNTVKAAVPAMIEAGNGGSIITVSSSAGIKAMPGCGHYVAAKFGVVGLTNSLAIELGEYGIRVNSIHPYGTNTPLAGDQSVLRMFEMHPGYLQSFSQTLVDNDRLIEPAEIAEVVAWLAGDASGVMTGAQIPVDKGYLKR
ncbi:Putative short chain dehydrogenase/reductase [Mycobacteroides abscessus]|uniref:mycofactocin-coupled SDR family oxidoreductase n=1 Tax=Mycobacteroides abscessus TaxID=36809 RepID=UPI0005E7A10A|nr:mycofactocin-coupled SDR family oxidoreductase [Mycobacteroides abscessus]CPU27369.1 Putative short chain dehydrogenase/reductase [Mycobacteroides abscessus]CPX66777.1 Putative short chain dehydrogenase/reductase [Mycobacteroides abscessus]CPZ69068.1 Putative short chain dehydrogenase/reductase [Mycobacteroides abscessus]